MSKAKAAGPFVQQFIVDGQWLGESPRGWQSLYGDLRRPSSIAFVCPYCCEIWARCPVSLPGGNPHWFQFVGQACRKCPTDSSHGKGIAGSLLSWMPDFAEAFPPEVWEREFLLHLSLYPES